MEGSSRDPLARLAWNRDPANRSWGGGGEKCWWPHLPGGESIAPTESWAHERPVFLAAQPGLAFASC